MRALTSILVLLVASCSGADEGGIPDGARLLVGRVHAAGGDNQRRAFQVVGVYAAPTCAAGAVRVGDAGGAAACAIFGEPFDPGEDRPFRLELPCDTTVNLVVQTLGDSGGQAPGDLLAVLAFPDGVTADGTTTLLAREPACRATAALATNFLDLGELTVPAAPPATGPATVVVGGPGGGANPLDTVDTDGDVATGGGPNAADPDDDGDGLPDATDDDDDGDGVPDAAQVFDPSWFATP